MHGLAWEPQAWPFGIFDGEVKSYFKFYRNLKHPNIINLIGYAVTDEQVVIVTNFINGNNLDKILFKKHLHDKASVKFSHCYYYGCAYYILCS